MKTYGLRPNRPRTGDGFFKTLHLRSNLDDVPVAAKTKGPAKTRWLRGIAAHLQLAIARATTDAAKGEKRTGKVSLSNYATVLALEKLGNQKQWTACPQLVQLLDLHTTFVKGDFAKQANQLEFKHVEKIGHYFDGNNQPRKPAVAHYLSFRLLKESPQQRADT